MSSQDKSSPEKKNHFPEAIIPNKSMLVLIASACFAALTLLMIFSGNESTSLTKNEQPLLIQSSRVQVATLALKQEYMKPRTVYGQVEAVQQSDIGFELNGTLNNLEVLEGATVKKDDVLAKLNVARLLARKNELKSTLKNAQANKTLAKLSQQRVKELVRSKIEPQQSLDEAQAQFDAASALTGEVTAKLSSLDVEFQKSRLKAPFDGQIVRQYLDKGTVVNAGQAIFSIIAKTGLEARFGLPEQTAFSITPQSIYMLTVQGTNFPAISKSIDKQRNQATRTIDAVFTIDLANLSTQQKQLIIAGDLVSLTVDISQQKTGAWVPMSALSSGLRGMWTLYVISPNDEIETRLVSIEFSNEQSAYVTGAIAEGDRIVVTGIHRLTPKQKVLNIEQVSLSENGNISNL